MYICMYVYIYVYVYTYTYTYIRLTRISGPKGNVWGSWDKDKTIPEGSYRSVLYRRGAVSERTIPEGTISGRGVNCPLQDII